VFIATTLALLHTALKNNGPKVTITAQRHALGRFAPGTEGGPIRSKTCGTIKEYELEKITDRVFTEGLWKIVKKT